MKRKIVYSTKSSEYFLRKLLASLKYRNHLVVWPMVKTDFPDGESYHRFNSELYDLHDEDVVVIGSTQDDTSTMELYDMCYHLSKEGIRTLTIVIPFFGYSTMERAVKKGEIVKAKTRAALLSSIPSTMRNRIVFVDLHSEGIPHYFGDKVQPVHLYAKELVMDMCRKAGGLNFVLGSTDAGRAKWVESLANEMNVECAIITKRRVSGSETEVSGINADVKDKRVVIYDDMIRTGGSLIGAAEAYRKAGAVEVYAVATHGVLPKGSIEKLWKSQQFNKVFVTNTHPNVERIQTRLKGGVEKVKCPYCDGICEVCYNKASEVQVPVDFLQVHDVSSLLFNYLVKN